jgi:S1-C subfamily serine protease
MVGMRQRLLGLVCAVLFAPALAAADTLPAPPACTVLIVTPFSAAQSAYAAGVILRERSGRLEIVTAAHVPNLDRALVITQRGEALRVSEVAPIPGHDLALLKTAATALQYPPATLAATLSYDQPVDVWGFPQSTTPQVARGTILSTAAEFPGRSQAHIALHCVSCARGDSGAGVFTQDGRLAGILTGGWEHPDGTAVFIEVEPIDVAIATLSQ